MLVEESSDFMISEGSYLHHEPATGLFFYARRIQFIPPYPSSIQFILVLSSYLPNIIVYWAGLLFHILEVHITLLGDWLSSWSLCRTFRHSFQPRGGVVRQNRQGLLPSTSFPIHYLPVNLLFYEHYVV